MKKIRLYSIGEKGIRGGNTQDIWAKILEILVEDTDFERVMIDIGHVKVYSDAADARGGNQEMGLTIVPSNK